MKLVTHIHLVLLMIISTTILYGGIFTFKNYLEAYEADILLNGKGEAIVITGFHDARCYYKSKTGQNCWSNSWDVRNRDERDNPKNIRIVKIVEQGAGYLIISNWINTGSIGFVD